MKKSLLQNAFFTAALVMFFGLMITGGSRLIAAPEAEEMTVCAAAYVEASLICPPEGAVQYILTGRQETRHADNDALGACEYSEICRSMPVTDANGNIVMHCSYMHAVYQSFALGDGFV